MNKRQFMSASLGMLGVPLLDRLASAAQSETTAGELAGHCEPGFELVRAEFERNFRERGEHGAGVAVYLEGRAVVDLWGGFSDYSRKRAWRDSTVVYVQSVVKGHIALCAHVLVDQGKLELEAPVADYWPEFAQSGKDDITVRQLISHHAGLIYPDHAPPGSMTDWDTYVKALEKQRPEWPPGTKGAYHSSTIIHLVGELINRVAGRPFHEVFRTEIAERASIEFTMSADDEWLAKCADYIPNPKNQTLLMVEDPTTKIGRAWRAIPAGVMGRERTYVECRPGLPYGNARGLARLYGALACGGQIDGVRILSSDLVETVTAEQWEEEECGLTGRHFRMAMGFFLDSPWLDLGPNTRNFGFAGGGGVVGFADPDLKMGFGYTPNFMNWTSQLGDRCDALIESVYRSLS